MKDASKANESLTLDEEKQRAREQWSRNPCGAETARAHKFGTREFFDEIERYRYTQYAPWMPSVMGFDQFEGRQLLEVGCGMGTDLLQFARGGARCTGMDITPRSIEITRQHFAVYDERANFLIGDGEHLPFADEIFDVVYSNGVLHHVPDTAGAVREIHRVLKRSGIAKVMLYYRHSLNYWGELMLRRGVLGGELLRGHSPEQIMSRWVEYNEHGGRPLVKVYSRKEARELFKLFSEIKTEIEQMTRADFYGMVRFLPETLFRALRRSIGWNLIVTAKK